MKKFYVNSKGNLNGEELRTGKVSYRRLIGAYISDLVLCNNIIEIDENVDFNVNCNFAPNEEIFQYYLCNLSEYEKECLEEYGIILSYSDKLDLDVLLVDHWGTSWDYVMTEIEWTTDFDECR